MAKKVREERTRSVAEEVGFGGYNGRHVFDEMKLWTFEGFVFVNWTRQGLGSVWFQNEERRDGRYCLFGSRVLKGRGKIFLI